MKDYPRKKIKEDALWETKASTYTSSGSIKSAIDYATREPSLTLTQVQAVVDEASERIIQTICDAVERMIQDANDR